MAENGRARRALAARWYLDEDVFRREQEAIFARSWQFACHGSQLARPGDFHAFSAGRARLFLLVDREGRRRCFHNVCRHRGHALVEGSGRLPFVICPYHGWRYHLDGRLASVPGGERACAFDGGDIRLGEAKTELFCGFVFVNLDPQARPMAAWYPGAAAGLAAFLPAIDELRPVTETVVEEACNWKVSVENYNECYHCKLRHPALTGGVVDVARYDVAVEGHCLRHSAPPARAAAGNGGAYSSWFLWPTISFQVYPGGVLNSYRWQASGPRRVTVTRGWYAREDEAEQENARTFARRDLETTVAEDVAIVESVQCGLESGLYDPGPLVIDPAGGVMSEHPIAALQDWLFEALESS